jgi:hypothetical protein
MAEHYSTHDSGDKKRQKLVMLIARLCNFKRVCLNGIILGNQNNKMPTSLNASGGAIVNSITPSLKPISNPKNIVITPAKNGFIVQMQKTTEYGQEYAVASSIEEISKLIEDYLS